MKFEFTQCLKKLFFFFFFKLWFHAIGDFVNKKFVTFLCNYLEHLVFVLTLILWISLFKILTAEKLLQCIDIVNYRVWDTCMPIGMLNWRFLYEIYVHERCYVYNIFTTNNKWLVVIGSNLKLTLRLLFCPNNNNQ